VRGSLFMGSPWARTPVAPLGRARLSQTCPIDAAPGECTVPDAQPPATDPSTTPTTTDHSVSAFPIVPVAAAAGGLILLATLLKG